MFRNSAGVDLNEVAIMLEDSVFCWAQSMVDWPHIGIASSVIARQSFIARHYSSLSSLVILVRYCIA